MIATKWIFLAIGIIALAAGIYKGNAFVFGYGVLLLIIAIAEACSKGDHKGGFNA